MTHNFLSDDWVEEARKIREEYKDRVTPVPHIVKMNMVVTEVPFSEEPIDAHLDTTDGEVIIESGHIDDSDLKVTVDYVTARSILVDGNPQAGMQAFMSGKIKIEGDMSKLFALQATPPDATTQEIAERLRAITT